MLRGIWPSFQVGNCKSKLVQTKSCDRPVILFYSNLATGIWLPVSFHPPGKKSCTKSLIKNALEWEVSTGNSKGNAIPRGPQHKRHPWKIINFATEHNRHIWIFGFSCCKSLERYFALKVQRVGWHNINKQIYPWYQQG